MWFTYNVELVLIYSRDLAFILFFTNLAHWCQNEFGFNICYHNCIYISTSFLFLWMGDCGGGGGRVTAYLGWVSPFPLVCFYYYLFMYFTIICLFFPSFSFHYSSISSFFLRLFIYLYIHSVQHQFIYSFMSTIINSFVISKLQN